MHLTPDLFLALQCIVRVSASASAIRPFDPGRLFLTLVTC